MEDIDLMEDKELYLIDLQLFGTDDEDSDDAGDDSDDAEEGESDNDGSFAPWFALTTLEWGRIHSRLKTTAGKSFTIFGCTPTSASIAALT